ncbi:hypothetical protein [Roseimaritima ulvae]|uniref:hypothetical protein n=2 Tax=Roseimaritima ulvae TaxID=980254 RepID=UPI0011CDB112|nr:hypothetical protein [Roseimaritima ulvae]
MLAELAGFLTDFLGACLRGAFGRNAKGQPDPDNPVNRRAIFTASVVVFSILALLGSLMAMIFAGSFIAAWVTATIIFGLGLFASFRAVFP